MDVQESFQLRDAWLSAALGRNAPAAPRAQARCVYQRWEYYLRTGQSFHGMPFLLNGQTYPTGLGTHAPSEIEVVLDAPAQRLTGWVGVDDNIGSRHGLPEVGFSVEIEGERVWESPLLTRESPPAALDIPLNGATRFTLKTGSPLAVPAFAHSDWADLRLTFEDGSEAVIGESVASRRVPRRPIFSLQYGGRSFAELLPHSTADYESETFPAYKLHRLAYAMPDKRLSCVLEIKEFHNHPAIEWVIRLRNDDDSGGGGGASDTAILEDIQALDIVWPATGVTGLHRSHGTRSGIDDFAYQFDHLPPGSEIGMAAGGGRSSDTWLPFFNLQTADCGLLAAIGWSGQWAAKVSRVEDDIRFRAGLERTHLVLHPGEDIRTPSVMLLFWHGEPLDGNNLLRRLMIDQYTPRPDGQAFVPLVTSGVWGGSTTGDDLKSIAFLREHEFQVDVFGADAGWYGTAESWSPREITMKWYGQAGNWYPNPAAHPGGFREVGDAAHAAGMKFSLWLEPERAVWDTDLPQTHPDWYLGEPGPGNNMLLNFGHPEARQWAVEFVSSMVRDWGVDIYRQDFNFEPLEYWRAADVGRPDRQGMTETLHIQGLYAFWDELLLRHPSLIIDNCASGGRRLDIELARRSVPFWRSDYQCNAAFDPLGAQNQTAGLSLWLPITGTAVGLRDGDTYNFRSGLCAIFGFAAIPSEVVGEPVAYDWEWRRARLVEYKRARDFFAGDYYSLTRFSNERDCWFAYQLHRPDLNAGIALAFRRDQCPYPSADLGLCALDASRVYRLEDADTGETWLRSGTALADGGLQLSLPHPRSTRMIFYEMVQAG